MTLLVDLSALGRPRGVDVILHGRFQKGKKGALVGRRGGAYSSLLKKRRSRHIFVALLAAAELIVILG